MASGDPLIDEDGNRKLDADGNPMVDDGAGNECDCGCGGGCFCYIEVLAIWDIDLEEWTYNDAIGPFCRPEGTSTAWSQIEGVVGECWYVRYQYIGVADPVANAAACPEGGEDGDADVYLPDLPFGGGAPDDCP